MKRRPGGKVARGSFKTDFNTFGLSGLWELFLGFETASRQKAILLLALLLVTPAGLAREAQAPLDDQAIRAYLDQIHGRPGMMNVPRADGEFLHDFIVEHGYQRGLEIGTSNGYSAMWMGMALRQTGGRLLTLEIDKHRASLARKNFEQVKLGDIIELQEGDALKIIPELEGPFDFIFIDAWKPDYIRYLQMLYPKVRRGGAILAHNVLSHSNEMQDFLWAIENHPDLETRIERRSSAGISVSRKRR
jgi:predicted O-methyltransferase YrrM